MIFGTHRSVTQRPDGDKTAAGGASREQRGLPIYAHVVPFVAWVAAFFVMRLSGEPAAWKYGAVTTAGLAVFLGFRPWRWYDPPRPRNIPLALLAGGVVWVIWIGPETGWFASRWPTVREAYLRYAVDIWRYGKDAETAAGPPSGYAPEVCGWPLSIARLLGSVLVIAVIEEFFWRGFLYRWILNRRFLSVDLGKFHWPAFVAVVVFFGLEHDRWVAGIIAGMSYGYLIIWTRDLWAGVLAHAVSNLLLGIYVLASGSYYFW